MVVLRRQLPGGLGGILQSLPLLPTPHSTTDRPAGLTITSPLHSIHPVFVSSSSVLISSTASSTSTSATPSSTISTTSSELPTTASVTPTTTISTTSLTTPVAIQTITSDGDALTVTQFTTASPSPTVEAESASSGSGNGFLQNKVLSSIVFAIVGVVGLVIILTILTIAIRRSRKKRLVEEAISFDPVAMGGNTLDRGSLEKSRFSLISSDHGHGGGSVNGTYTTYAPPSSIAAAYARQDAYRPPPPMHQDNPYVFNSGIQQPPYGNGSNMDSQLANWLYPNHAQPIQPPPPPSAYAYTQNARF